MGDENTMASHFLSDKNVSMMSHKLRHDKKELLEMMIKFFENIDMWDETPYNKLFLEYYEKINQHYDTRKSHLDIYRDKFYTPEKRLVTAIHDLGQDASHTTRAYKHSDRRSENIYKELEFLGTNLYDTMDKSDYERFNRSYFRQNHKFKKQKVPDPIRHVIDREENESYYPGKMILYPGEVANDRDFREIIPHSKRAKVLDSLNANDLKYADRMPRAKYQLRPYSITSFTDPQYFDRDKYKREIIEANLYG